MEIRPDGVMKTKAEMDEVWRRYNRNRLVCAIIPIGLVFLLVALDISFLVWFNTHPLLWMESFFKKHWLIILILAYIVLSIFERSKFNWKYFESWRIPLLKVTKPYKKAEEDIIYGIQREREKWVERGVQNLESLDEYLSEMPEYRELLEKGRNWLRERHNSTGKEKN